MFTTKYIVTAALVAAIVALELRKREQRPTCGTGAKWHEATDIERELYKAGPTAESIRKWGGFCARTGSVSDPYAGGVVDDIGADEPDSYLITSPSQV